MIFWISLYWPKGPSLKRQTALSAPPDRIILSDTSIQQTGFLWASNTWVSSAQLTSVGITACTDQPILTAVLLSSPCSRWTVILVPAVAMTVGPRRARLHTGRWPTARLKQGYTADEVSTRSQGDQRSQAERSKRTFYAFIFSCFVFF